MKLRATLKMFGLLCSLSAGLVHGQVLFSDNFQSYASGSNLFGQGGWTGQNSGFNQTLRVGTGTYLPTIVAAARGSTDILNISFARNTLASALSSGQVTTLSFTGYGTTDSPASENSSFGFARTSDTMLTGPVASWGAYDTGWALDLRAATGNSGNLFYDVVPFNVSATFELVVDGPAGEIYGRYNTGAGFTETTHYAISSAMIASIDAVGMIVDYQTNASRGTAEFDNVSVQAIPEPSTYALLFGVAVLARTVIVRRNTRSGPTG